MQGVGKYANIKHLEAIHRKVGQRAVASIPIP